MMQIQNKNSKLTVDSKLRHNAIPLELGLGEWSYFDIDNPDAFPLWTVEKNKLCVRSLPGRHGIRLEDQVYKIIIPHSSLINSKYKAIECAKVKLISKIKKDENEMFNRLSSVLDMSKYRIYVICMAGKRGEMIFKNRAKSTMLICWFTRGIFAIKDRIPSNTKWSTFVGI